MTHIVRLRQSGRDFPIEANETVLDAALRAGVYIQYGCSNGSCGDCKARLLEGRPGPAQPHDFRLGEPARDAGWFLACRTTAASDLLIDAREIGEPEDVPRQRITAKVARLDRHGDGILVLSVRTPRSHTLRFLAGQRVTLTLPGGQRATLPIASCPCNGLILEFHLFRNPGSPFPAAAFETLHQGDRVELDGPSGTFTLADDSPRAQLFLTFEASFASTKSLIEHAISVDEDRPRRLLWLARDRACHYLANLGRAWADSLEDFRFIPILIAPGDWDRALEATLDQLNEMPDADIYVCGPSALTAAAGIRLADHAARGALYLDPQD